MTQCTHQRFYGVMVSTQDSESCDPSSNLGRTWMFFVLLSISQLPGLKNKAPARFELAISCLLDRRFNQLSHGAEVDKGVKIVENVSPNVGLEPTTLRLRVSCSTDWASRAHVVCGLCNKSRSPQTNVLWIVWYVFFTWIAACRSRSPWLNCFELYPSRMCPGLQLQSWPSG